MMTASAARAGSLHLSTRLQVSVQQAVARLPAGPQG
jgi:hypothetical protein